MNTLLSREQVEAYRRDGYVAHRGLLDEAEVGELKAAVLAAIASMGKKKITAGGASIEEGESYYDKVFTQRLNLWRINDLVKRVLLGPQLGEMLGALTDADGLRVWHDQALIKEPYGNPTGWHLDNPYWSFHSRDAISVWIALEPATLENGCMWFAPGSHHLARYDNVDISENLADLFDIYPEMKGVDPVAVPMQPGDCCFHNGLTAHAAGANMTRSRRIAMTCAYMPVGSTFNGAQNVLSPDYFASLAKGDELANDDWNPVVWPYE